MHCPQRVHSPGQLKAAGLTLRVEGEQHAMLVCRVSCLCLDTMCVCRLPAGPVQQPPHILRHCRRVCQQHAKWGAGQVWHEVRPQHSQLPGGVMQQQQQQQRWLAHVMRLGGIRLG